MSTCLCSSKNVIEVMVTVNCRGYTEHSWCELGNIELNQYDQEVQFR